MIDKYGNYSCQKLYPLLDLDIKLRMLMNIDFKMIGCNETGTYPLQYIIETASNQAEKSLILDKINEIFFDLSFNKFGCHIVEKSLLNSNEEILFKKFDLVMDNFLLFACDANGIKILKIFAINIVNRNEEFSIFEDIKKGENGQNKSKNENCWKNYWIIIKVISLIIATFYEIDSKIWAKFEILAIYQLHKSP